MSPVAISDILFKVIVISFVLFRRIRHSPSNVLILCLSFADILLGIFLVLSIILGFTNNRYLKMVSA